MPADPVEAPVDPRRRIIDAHHHLWADGQGLAGSPAYLLEDLQADLGGHNVVGTVYMECGVSFRAEGPEALRPVGETEFAAAEAERSQGWRAPILGIVAFADLMLGDAVEAVLEAHAAAAQGLLRGVRPNIRVTPGANGQAATPARDVLPEAAFRDGLRRLGRGGYVFDAFVNHTQLAQLAQAARDVPETTFVLNHLGVPLNRDPQGDRGAVTASWRQGMRETATCPNLRLKIGGIGMDALFGTGWTGRAPPPGSDEVVAWWGDDIEFCIDTFGPSRCLFESNFPVDRWALGYTTIWNAFQKIAARYGEAEQDDMFAGVAERTYCLHPGGKDAQSA